MVVAAADTTDEPTKHETSPWLFRRLACAFALLLLGGLFSLRLGIFQTRWFNPDEFEHMHASWCVTEGMVPYRDFFEHHTPWLWYLLAPLVAGGAPASDASAAFDVLIAARAASLVVSAAALCALIWLGRRWNGLLCGVVSALCLAGLRMFLYKTTEIRPDVPALLSWIGCLVGLAYALRAPESREARRGPFLAAGFCLGATIMLNQKILFAIPGLGAAVLAWMAFASPRSVRADRVRALGWFVAGLCVPPAATWAYFAAHGAAWDFLHSTFLLNARWKAVEPREPWLHQLMTEEWPVSLLAVGGVAVWLWELASARRCDWLGLMFIASGISLLLGLLVIPIAFSQYYLPLLPLLTLFAARLVAVTSERLPAKLRWVWLLPVLTLLQIIPVKHVWDTREWLNDGQRTQLAYVFANSAPADRVLDGWRGLGVFRPHAWYYWHLPNDVRGMLPPDALNAFLADLDAGRVKPKLVVADINLTELSPRLVAFVRARYTYGGYDIWIRKPDA